MKKQTLLFGFVLLIIGSYPLSAQNLLNRDSLATDFSYLVKILKETHPDPYSGFGGRVSFHQSAFQLEKELMQKDLTLQQFTDKVQEFLSNIQDGHTQIFPQRSKGQPLRYLPIQTRVIPDDIILVKLPSEYSDLIGSRLISIHGVMVDSLLNKVAAINPCENIYGRYAALNSGINQYNYLSLLFPALEEEIVLKVKTPQNEVRELKLPFISKDEWDQCACTKAPSWNRIESSEYMHYTFLDDDNENMYFKMESIMARENYQYTLENNWPNAYRGLKNFYQWRLKKEIPQDSIQALKEAPSFSEAFLSMLKEMKRRQSKRLIIDLRNNSGGWTPVILPGLYMLYGDSYLNTDMSTEFHRRLSPLYLKKMNLSLSQFREKYGKELELGDYLFQEKSKKNETDITTLREQFIANCMSATKDELRKQQGNAVYTPDEIYVLTNENTFSAAFHFAYYLRKMGAVVVGVPSAQAPNTFMEGTPFALPYTQVEGTISNSMQVFLPVKDHRAKIFWPDLMPNYDDYKKHGFDTHTEILYLQD